MIYPKLLKLLLLVGISQLLITGCNPYPTMIISETLIPGDLQATTTLPGERVAWNKSGVENALEPYRAVTREEVFNDPGGYRGYIFPKENMDYLIVVFFKLHSQKVSKQDLNWLIRDEEDNSYPSIGIGLPITKEIMPDEIVVMKGIITAGDLSNFNGGVDPLLALTFVVPRDKTKLILRDPNGNEGELQISTGWSPGAENMIYSYSIGGSVEIRASGEDWIVRNEK